MKFETKIFYKMTHHLNKNFHSKKSDEASLKQKTKQNKQRLKR